MREAVYQNKLIKKLQRLFPGCFIMKNDPSENQGIPDLLILFGKQWAMLECKVPPIDYEPNQEYFVGLFNEMSFAAIICPENEEEILSALQFTFGD